MYQTIGEAIAVMGVYKTSGFQPLRFQWREKVYAIDEITLVTETKNGGVPGRMYSVVSKANVYRITFNRRTEAWKLEEVWCE